MAQKRRFLLCITILYCLFPASCTINVVNYTVSVIRHLSEIESGTLTLIFYGTSLTYPFEPHIEEILKDSRLEFAAKFVISEHTENVPVRPSLLLIEGKPDSSRYSLLFKILRTFDPITRTIVLVSTSSDDFRVYRTFLGQYLSYYKVVYLDSENRRTVVTNIVKSIRLRGFPNPTELFRKSSRQDLRGRPITYSLRRPLDSSKPSQRWLRETATFLNTTTREILHSCQSTSSISLMDQCYLEHKFVNKVDFDVWVYSLRKVENNLFKFLLTTLTEDNVILVPRSPISIVKLFTLPFEWNVWVLIIAMFCAVKILSLTFPSVFRNDPILLVVCGYERFSLHKARSMEKLVLLGFIVFTFFITHAFETKFLSVMISRPATREIKSIQELIDSGVKIKVNLLGTPDFANHEILRNKLVNCSEDVSQMDYINAYIGERRISERLLPRYYDSENRLQRYRIMDQTLGMFVVAYEFSVRNPLKEAFGYTHTVLIESGILRYWDMVYEHLVRKKSLLSGNTRTLLTLSDLLPAFLTIMYGFVFSFLIFIIEIVYFKFFF